MKTKLTLILMLFMTGTSILAQDTTDTRSKLSLGINAAIYKQDVLGLEAKWMREKMPSFMLRLNYFNIDNKAFETELTDPQILTHRFTMQGLTLKPGIIILQHRDRNTYLYLGMLGVVTASQHQLKFDYNDAFGLTSQSHKKNYINYGAELEFGGDIFLSSKIYLGLQIKTGIKQNSKNLFNNIVSNHNSFYNYTPTQGYGKEPYYINFGLSLGVHL